MRGVLIIAVVLGAVAGIGGRLALRSQTEPVDQPVPKNSTTPWPNIVSAKGVIEGTRPEVALRPEIAGAIKAIHVRENQEVAPGTLLVELNNETQKAQVLLAQADVAETKALRDRLQNGERKEKRLAQAAVVEAKHAMYQSAKADWDRSQSVKTPGAVSKKDSDADRYKMHQAKADWDAAQAELALVEAPARLDEMAAAEARIAAADARLKLAEAELAKTRLLAPFQGRILQVYTEPGEMAGPTSLQPILLLADLSRRRVRAFVEELDISRVQVGQTAIITAEGLPGKEYAGQLTLVVSRMGKRGLQSDAPGEYKDLYFREVLIDLNTQDDLPLNLRVEARIQVNPSEEER